MTAAQRSEVFVSVDELAKLVASRSGPIILDVGTDSEAGNEPSKYTSGHIPGAVYVDLPKSLQATRYEFSGSRPLPSIAELQVHARWWGIDVDSEIILYDHEQGSQAARGWFVLRWAGLESVRLLDGGYAAWTEAGGAVSQEIPAAGAGSVVLSEGHLPVLDSDQAAEYARAGALYDARSISAYVGSTDSPFGSSGHIPGAFAAPTSDNLTPDGRLKDEGSLRQRFDALDIDGRSVVGLYCGGGVAASHEFAVLASLGLPAALYVGSFSAWSSDPSRPIAVGASRFGDATERP